jgi:gas vesicle protein
MAKEDSGAGGTIISAFVLGTLTGAAVALLMAPAAGDEIRRKVAAKAREGADRAAEAARQGREFMDQQRGTVVEAIERGREAYKQARTGSVTPPAPGEDAL